MTNPVADAIEIAGSEAKLGTRCGVSQTAIWKAKKVGRTSAKLAKAIDIATDGRVPKWRLCPEVFDPPVGLAPLQAAVAHL